MFTAIKGNNGRTIYVGMVGEKDDTSLRLEGTEWDANIQMQVPRMIECTLTAETAEKTKNVRVGHYLMVMLMPSKDNPDVGIAEEVGAIGDILSITNIKNNPKKIVLGVIRSAKRSESGSSMIIGMTGLKEYGKEIGHASSYIGSDGETRESYWTSFVGCNSTKYQNMVADRLERSLKKMDLVTMIFHETEGEYNGQPDTTRFIDRFAVVYRNRAASEATAPATAQQPQPQQPQCQQPQQPRQSAAPQQPQQPQYQSAQQPQQPAVVQQPQYQQPQQPQYQQQSGVDNGGYYELPDDMLDDLPFA
ncbi:hypothetical protein C818_02687 [Lachnospiraceae bacterium MD308]|jgi:pyruvate/2-oxoglutarate dehydrogenase complex dihydrolipoamide acyltransferase (E2) component|nr:hypothetical protein C818_02687 [Lachnospiraceae bacterium MD308]